MITPFQNIFFFKSKIDSPINAFYHEPPIPTYETALLTAAKPVPTSFFNTFYGLRRGLSRDSVTRFSTFRFFRQTITPRPLINTLKYFRILFRIRRAIYENVLIPRYAA
jgi:hypothetical protein